LFQGVFEDGFFCLTRQTANQIFIDLNVKSKSLSAKLLSKGFRKKQKTSNSCRVAETNKKQFGRFIAFFFNIHIRPPL
jgi:hypothetical protein